MKTETIMNNIRLAEVFISRARIAAKKIDKINGQSADSFYKSKETAALRRVSMELTRSLSALRAGK